MHPRQDLTHHPLVPALLAAGAAVWTQHTRSVNNDLTLVHEQALLDVAAGLVFLRDRGSPRSSRSGTPGAARCSRTTSSRPGCAGADRIATTPGGRPTKLADAAMPVTDGVVFLAPHPGQGRLLLGCIDPSVSDERDPLAAVGDLDLFDPANGFAEPPRSSTYTPEFLERYRAAQRDRVARIDATAHALVARAAEARAAHKRSGAAADRRRALAPHLITVFRTDADPRTVDLSLDPSERPYGSLFGTRPDLINYGQVGFGRLTTPEAWLSTWSGLSSHADFARCAPGVAVPTLFVELTGDQAAFPADTRAMVDALGRRRPDPRRRARDPFRRGDRGGGADRQRAGRRADRVLAGRAPRARPAGLTARSGCGADRVLAGGRRGRGGDHLVVDGDLARRPGSSAARRPATPASSVPARSPPGG